MHIYVSHWHADGTRTLIEIKNFTESGSYESATRTEYGADGNQVGVPELATTYAGISIAEQKLTINAIAKTSENKEPVEFLSGYAISAGQEAVSVINGEPSNHVELQYLDNVHLAKIHVFYSPNPEQV